MHLLAGRDRLNYFSAVHKVRAGLRKNAPHTWITRNICTKKNGIQETTFI